MTQWRGQAQWEKRTPWRHLHRSCESCVNYNVHVKYPPVNNVATVKRGRYCARTREEAGMTCNVFTGMWYCKTNSSKYKKIQLRTWVTNNYRTQIYLFHFLTEFLSSLVCCRNGSIWTCFAMVWSQMSHHSGWHRTKAQSCNWLRIFFLLGPVSVSDSTTL